VQGYESELFASLFTPPGIVTMEGGVETGFHHVKPEEYRPRLLHVSSNHKAVRVKEVPLARASLNDGDCFILDLGLELHQLDGSKCSIAERAKVAQLAHAIEEEREGKAKVIVHAMTDDDIPWDKLEGGKGPIAAAAAPEESKFEKVLYKLSDTTGKMEFHHVARGAAVKRSLLTSDDVFVLDDGAEIFAWVGKKASPQEKKLAMGFAQTYLTKHNRPPHLPLTRIIEGGENPLFEAAFH